MKKLYEHLSELEKNIEIENNKNIATAWSKCAMIKNEFKQYLQKVDSEKAPDFKIILSTYIEKVDKVAASEIEDTSTFYVHIEDTVKNLLSSMQQVFHAINRNVGNELPNYGVNIEKLEDNFRDIKYMREGLLALNSNIDDKLTPAFFKELEEDSHYDEMVYNALKARDIREGESDDQYSKRLEQEVADMRKEIEEEKKSNVQESFVNTLSQTMDNLRLSVFKNYSKEELNKIIPNRLAELNAKADDVNTAPDISFHMEIVAHKLRVEYEKDDYEKIIEMLDASEICLSGSCDNHLSEHSYGN